MYFLNTKYIIIILVLCIALKTSEAVRSKGDVIKKFFEFSKICLAETEVLSDVLTDFIAFKPAKSYQAKCFVACLMTKSSTLSEDGRLDKPSMMKITQIYANGDPKKVQDGEQIIDSCRVIKVSEDRCEAADTYVKCLRTLANEKNIEFV